MTTAAIATMTTLRDLLKDRASRESIHAFLDGLPPIDRVEMALSLSGKDVGRLYRAVAGGRTTTIEDFVPTDTPDEQTVIFHGRNSLPAFTSFQKRFARLPSGQVVGYNHQTMGFVTGPGFFVVQASSAHADVPDEAYFDYTGVPQKAPAGWPTYKPNDAGLSVLVYANMKDYMREVATNVFVGEAYKGGKSQKQFFILAREG